MRSQAEGGLRPRRSVAAHSLLSLEFSGRGHCWHVYWVYDIPLFASRLDVLLAPTVSKRWTSYPTVTDEPTGPRHQIVWRRVSVEAPR